MNKIEKIIRDYMVENDGIHLRELCNHLLLSRILYQLLEDNKIMYDEKSRHYIWIAADSKQSKILREKFTVVR